MDEKTLLEHRSLWVAEPEEKRFTDELKNLTGPEQERIQYEYVVDAVLNRGGVTHSSPILT